MSFNDAFGTWTNWLRDTELTHTGPIVKPKTKGELLAAVSAAVAAGRCIRAVGSGHSYSSCAKPRDIYADISELNGLVTDPFLKKPAPGLAAGETAVRLLAGTTIKTLNRDILPAKKLALPNMGSFDAQTLAGAISTGTHGTGLKLGSLADLVLSMEIVTVEVDPQTKAPKVAMYRIEPTNGITDAAAFNAASSQHSTKLEQNDETFYASVVSFGCIGIVYSYTLRVIDEHWLQEDIQNPSWFGLRGEIEKKGGAAAWASDKRNRWFLLNLAAAREPPKNVDLAGCLVISRSMVPVEDKPKNWLAPHSWPPERIPTVLRDLYLDVGANFDAEKDHPAAAGAVNNAFKIDANRAPFMFGYTRTASYIAHRRQRDASDNTAPPEPPPEGLSIELAAPVDRTVELVEKAAKYVGYSKYSLVVPMGVRFAASSNHYMASNFGRDTVYIEIPMVLPRAQAKYAVQLQDIAKPELGYLATKLMDAGFEARPHLGKHNMIANSQLNQLFPSYAKWYANYKRFNQLGTFNNDFTDQLGISIK